ncbi:response regulator [Candidatus Woesearchaeota archaeon]|nr:response regulator [Candidatus Woesearchaeota archaeon]
MSIEILCEDLIESAQQNDKVLFVDDDPILRKSMTRVIKMHGYNVDNAKDTYSALELCKKNNYSLIITDYDMPINNGLALLKSLKKMKYPCPVFLYSSHCMLSEEVAKEMGFAGYCSKTEIMDIMDVIKGNY